MAPKLTAVAPVKPVPVIVTEVPPVSGPTGRADARDRGCADHDVNVNWSAAPVALVPPGVVTVMSTVPALWAGEVAVIDVALLTVNVVAAVAPKLTRWRR